MIFLGTFANSCTIKSTTSGKNSNDSICHLLSQIERQINHCCIVCRFDEDLRTIAPWANSSWSQTDLLRLKRGRITAQVSFNHDECHWHRFSIVVAELHCERNLRWQSDVSPLISNGDKPGLQIAPSTSSTQIQPLRAVRRRLLLCLLSENVNKFQSLLLQCLRWPNIVSLVTIILNIHSITYGNAFSTFMAQPATMANS